MEIVSVPSARLQPEPGLNGMSGQQARDDVLDLIPQLHPRRVWLYVKHLRWMFSDEYAMMQDNYIGTAPIFEAKTKALIRPEIEDEIVRGELLSGRGVLS